MKISKLGCTGLVLVLLFAAAVVLVATCSEKVLLNRVAVRNLLAQQKIEPVDYDAGYVLAIPGVHAVRQWDTTWTAMKETLQIRASDQYTTTVDISVIYRIAPGRAHEVALHFADEKRIDDRVKTTLSKFANEILAQMKTEDFYNTATRAKTAALAQEAMDEQLKASGIEVKYVLLRNIIYDPKFEEQLLQKQLAGQKTELEKSKTLLATEQTITDLIRRDNNIAVTQIQEKMRQEIENRKADTDRRVAKILQDAKLEAASILAAAESTRRQKMAQSELLKANAVAAGTALMSRAYAQPGAAYFFARKAIENLRLGEVELNSNSFNPLDSARLLLALGLDKTQLPSLPPQAPSAPQSVLVPAPAAPAATPAPAAMPTSTPSTLPQPAPAPAPAAPAEERP